jgi:type IV pilus assembly protein PilC
VARFTRTFATLINAGLPVLTSLRITRATLGNRVLEAAIDRVCDEVQAGRTIAEPLERTSLFPPLLVQIVGLGEQTGRLGEVLDQAATAFEEQTEQSVKVLTTVLPPILIIVLACLVGFVVLSILLPLIELQESIG